MANGGRLFRTVLVSAPGRLSDSLRTVLPPDHYDPVRVVTRADEAQRLLMEEGCDLLIVNSPLPDDPGISLALDATTRSSAAVLFLVRAEHFPEISARLTPAGVLTLQKPTSAQAVGQALGLLCATRERLRRMEERTATMEAKMEEIRIVNRAKWLLVEELRMTEPEAHRYIEKQAMDRCITRRAVAEEILSTYK